MGLKKADRHDACPPGCKGLIVLLQHLLLPASTRVLSGTRILCRSARVLHRARVGGTRVQRPLLVLLYQMLVVGGHGGHLPRLPGEGVGLHGVQHAVVNHLVEGHHVIRHGNVVGEGTDLIEIELHAV